MYSPAVNWRAEVIVSKCFVTNLVFRLRDDTLITNGLLSFPINIGIACLEIDF